MRQNDGAAVLEIRTVKNASLLGGSPQYGKKLRAGRDGKDLMRRAVQAKYFPCFGPRKRRQTLEAAAVGTKFLKIAVRSEDLRPWLADFGAPDSSETVGVSVRKGPKKYGIDDAKDGGVGADAEGEGENGDGGEARGLAKLAEGEAAIREERMEPIVNEIGRAHV